MNVKDDKTKEYKITSCGYPSLITIEGNPKQVMGLECIKDPVLFIKSDSDNYLPIFFASTENHYLSKNSVTGGKDIIAFYPGGIVAFNLGVDVNKTN